MHPMPAPHRPPARSASAPTPASNTLTEDDIDALQQLLDQVPAPLEPLDVSMLDGFLCGVLLQPRRVPDSQWLPYVTDVDGRPLPARFDARRLHELALRRHAEINAAILRREWFDPWVFELEEDATDPPALDADLDDDEAPPPTDAVYPWVAGFATAMEWFPDLMDFDAQQLTEPLALVYRHFAPDDLEDADALLAEIESLEPPSDLTEAVEGLVRATLLLADVSRPLPKPQASNTPRGPARRPGRR